MLRSISIKGFRSYRDVTIGPLDRVNWFFGKNASGKSTIIDAIAWALTGVCRGTDRGGRGAEALLTRTAGFEAVVCNVTLDTEKGKVSRDGPGSGPTSQYQRIVNRLLGVDVSIIRVMTDLTHILDAPPKEQQAILEQVLGISVTPEVVQQALGEDAAEVAGRPLASVDDLVALEEWVRQQRLLAKREADKAPKSVEQPEDCPPDIRLMGEADIEALVTQTEAQLNQRFEERGRLVGGNHTARRKALTESIARLVTETESMSARLRALKDPAAETAMVIKQMRRSQDVIASLESGASPQGDAAIEQKRIDLLKYNAKECAVCRRKFHGQAHSKLLDEAHVALEQHGQGVLGLNEEKATLRGLEARLAGLEADEVVGRTLADSFRAKAEALLTARAELQALPDAGAEPDTTAIDQKIAKGKAVLARLKDYLAVAKSNNAAMEAGLEAQVEVQKWERIVEAVGKLRATMTGERIQVFEAKANVILKPLGLAVKFGLDPLRIVVNGKQPVQLSESERMRVGIGLQMTLANLAGLRFVCIDRFDVFDDENGTAINDIIAKVRNFQFLICCTDNNPSSLAPSAPDCATFAVSQQDGLTSIEKLK